MQQQALHFSRTNAITGWGLFSLVMIILFAQACGTQAAAPPPPPPPPALPVQTIASSSDTTHQEYPASIEGLYNVEIRSQVAGTLDKVYVDEGAFVKSGEPLFKINELPYRAALNNAVAGLHAAEAASANASLEIEKLTPLVNSKVISEYQLKNARSAYDVTKANIEQAKANVSTAQINLGYTLIKAPVSGFISRLQRKQGSLVAPADPIALTQLSNVQNVHVYFSLGESDFIKFKEQYAGATLNDKLKHLPPVELLLADNTSYNQKGHIDMIDGQFDKTTGAITVRATFPNPQGLLRAGNTGKIRLGLKHDNVISIPQSATVELQDKVYVFALADSNKVKKQLITITGKNGTSYLVKEGVKSGDQIVLAGLDRLQDGMQIQPQKPAEKVSSN